jgi:hypothetical protein
MRISIEKSRTPLGEVLFKLPEWHRIKIKNRLIALGITEGGYRTIHERTSAYLLPTFVRDVIIEELPETELLFRHPGLEPKSEPA